jgi:hypothetical protein
MWKDITGCSPIYKHYGAQWNLFMVRDGVLKRHWESVQDSPNSTSPERGEEIKVENSMGDIWEDNCVSTIFCTKLDSGTIGYTREATWRGGANNVTLAVMPRFLNPEHNGRAQLERIAMVCDRIEACHDCLTNATGFLQEGDQVWLYHTTKTTAKPPRLHPPLDGSYKVTTQINDVI